MLSPVKNVASLIAPAHGPDVLVAHAGKQHAYRHAAAVHRAGRLSRFVTSSYYKPDCWPDRLFATIARLDRPLRRRWLEGLPSAKVRRRWSLELPEIAARTVFGNGSLTQSLIMRRDERFDHWVARRFADQGDIYWGFQGSCLESLQAAKRAGRIAVAEFPAAHVTKAIEVLSVEAQRHPEWADSISNFHFSASYHARLQQEPHAADFCIVASEFARQSLLEVGVPTERIRTLPLGADLRQFVPVDRPTGGKFRILFVGGVGQLKGIKYLLDAYRRIRSDSTELIVTGPIVGSGAALAPYRGEITLRGRVDQAVVVHEMQTSHVLVLPSVFEGFGMVIPEAMATGMPVIASTHSIGPEMIREGVDGYVLRPGDVDGLAERLAFLASHRETAAEMGRHAAVRAQDYSWDRHADRVRELIGQIWSERSNCTSREAVVGTR